MDFASDGPLGAPRQVELIPGRCVKVVLILDHRELALIVIDIIFSAVQEKHCYRILEISFQELSQIQRNLPPP